MLCNWTLNSSTVCARQYILSVELCTCVPERTLNIVSVENQFIGLFPLYRYVVLAYVRVYSNNFQLMLKKATKKSVRINIISQQTHYFIDKGATHWGRGRLHFIAVLRFQTRNCLSVFMFTYRAHWELFRKSWVVELSGWLGDEIVWYMQLDHRCLW